jgi:aminocarboxymuconate-semialdehyde decarboxylase
MTSRREFLGKTAALSGLAFVSCEMLAGHHACAQTRRRETTVAGKRALVVDVHAHCLVPEAMALMGLKIGSTSSFRPDLNMVATVQQRLATMDAQGIDIQALSINPFWDKAEREVAEKVILLQNEKLAEACAAYPDRFVAFATVSLNFPDLAVQQLEHGVKRLGLRGVSIGASVNGAELSDPKFHPFWAKVEELDVLVFIHPQADGATTQLANRLKGNGYLSNIIGFPVETSIALSHLIFEGTLDRYPRLKICGAHGGGFLPSYMGRSDAGCLTLPAACPGGTYGPIKKKPTDYLKQMYYDTMVFSPEGIRHLAAEVGASRLMVGTDYPFPWTKTAVDEVLATPGLTDSDKVAVLGGTAARLLRIKT